MAHLIFTALLENVHPGQVLDLCSFLGFGKIRTKQKRTNQVLVPICFVHKLKTSSFIEGIIRMNQILRRCFEIVQKLKVALSRFNWCQYFILVFSSSLQQKICVNRNIQIFSLTKNLKDAIYANFFLHGGRKIKYEVFAPIKSR